MRPIERLRFRVSLQICCAEFQNHVALDYLGPTTVVTNLLFVASFLLSLTTYVIIETLNGDFLT